MRIAEVKELLGARLLCGEDLLEREVRSACGADLMSDVLAFVKEDTVLLTGLINPQVIRTAEMLDVCCIVFVRGKSPTDDILEMAKSNDIVVLTTQLTLYTASGILYGKGLPGTAKAE